MTPNNAQNTRHKLGVAFTYIERNYKLWRFGSGIGSAITCLSSVPCTYGAKRLLTGRRGRPPFDVSGEKMQGVTGRTSIRA